MEIITLLNGLISADEPDLMLRLELRVWDIINNLNYEYI